MTDSEDTSAHLEQLFGQTSQRVRRYVDILLSRGVERGLIGPREADRVWERHVFNSVALADLVPEGSDVVDIGSGAGLPGIPLALARPDLDVVLLEPLQRRYDFLIEVVDELSLTDRVQVIRERAEDHHGAYDAVVARAVAPLDRLLGWSLPLLRADGVLLALKGAKAAEELAASARILRAAKRTGEVLEVRALPQTESTRVVRVRAVPSAV